MSQRIRVAVLHGGYSGERVISQQSLTMMMAALEATSYEAYAVLLDENGMTANVNGENLPVDLNDMKVPLKDGTLTFNVVLIAIHGTPGENGILQGYLDLVKMPYTTGGVLNMALTFNKAATTAQLDKLGFLVGRNKVLFSPQGATIPELVRAIGLPCFVKPNNGGSSIGMSRVNEEKDLMKALEKAFKEDDQVLVESFLKGREITCGVIPTPEGPKALPPVEIRTSNEFFDFEAKYNDERTEELVPAPIPEEMTLLCQRTAIDIYLALNCRGIIRIDMMMDEGRFSIIEVNTVPGFSKASIVPKMLKAAGIDPAQALTNAIVQALA